MLYQTFHTAGDKFIRLTVTNRKGRASSTVKTISVSATPLADGDGDGVADAQDVCPVLVGSPPDGCPAPTPAFSFTPSAPAVGQQVSFDASTTACPATPCSYAWSHNSTVFASGQTATFTYQTSGVKMVTLKVTDAQSRSVSLSRTLTVSDVSPPPAVPAEPSPIAGMGYHQTFRDDFDTLNRGLWDDHIWYDDPPSSTWTNFQYAQNGILHLATSRNYSCGSGCNYPINTVTTQTSGKTFQYGYFEARMKWSGGHGAWPGFWLYSYRHATNPSWPSVNPICSQLGEPVSHCYAGELDAFEGQGSEPQAFYGTLHRNSCGCYGVGDQQNGNNWQPGGVDLTAGFHTYGMLWTPTQVSWYLDGRLMMSATPYDSLNQPMFLLLQMWTGGWTYDPDSTTPSTIETQVDYLQVWQK
jgi:beta-glucanase (GH16 family)